MPPLAFFLVGADLYTAYTFVAVPSGVFGKGALYDFAVPYVAMTFGVAFAFTPRLWTLAKQKGYVTGSDFVKDKFSSRTLSILIAITGIVALLPYIALQIVGMQAVLAAMFAAGNIGWCKYPRDRSDCSFHNTWSIYVYKRAQRGHLDSCIQGCSDPD